MKELVIFACLLLIGITGIIGICSIPMPHALAATIGLFSILLAIVGGTGLWAILDDHNDDDDDGPHFYGPGGTII